MRRPSFLTLFFIGLSAAFVVALVIRIRHDANEPIPAASRTVAVAPPVQQSAEAQTRTVQPAIAPRPSVTPPASRQHVFTSSERGAVATGPARAGEPQPSMLARVLAPLVKALTPSAKPSATTKKPPAAETASIGSQGVKSSTAQQDQQSKDPNSDTTPPQLISFVFVPAEIHDGEQSTAVITAQDDLSGIRGISGSLASPTGGALQGFAAQRDGDSNRWLARVGIPKNGEQGAWRVRFLNLSDNASNSVTLSDAQGTIPPTAVLRVSSANSDSTPPSLKSIWVDRRAMHGGEKNTIFVDATDDDSGVGLVSLVFRSPSGHARIGAGCQPDQGEVWRCELSVPACLDCGDWQLEQVTLQDKANNITTIRNDNPIVQAVRINIQGDTCDNGAPTLLSVALDSNDLAVGPAGAVVTVSVMATADACSVSGASGQFAGPGPGSGGVFPLQRTSDGSWIGQIRLDPHAARGLWRITSIQLTDQGYNLRVYYSSDPLLQNAVFRVR